MLRRCQSWQPSFEGADFGHRSCGHPGTTSRSWSASADSPAVRLVYPFFQEDHLRRDRTVLRPVVQLSLGDPGLVVDALVDTGSEHVLADSALAFAAGIDLDDPIDTEEIGIGGGFVTARFVEVDAFLHPPNPVAADAIAWTLEVGFIDTWRPLYPCIVGNVGFLDRFTVTISRLAQATAVEDAEVFDDRFGTGPP